MTTFLRLLTDNDKATALAIACQTCVLATVMVACSGLSQKPSGRCQALPLLIGSVRRSAQPINASAHCILQPRSRIVCSTNPLNDDFRYVRLWWEVERKNSDPCWVPWAKGGSYSAIYYDIDTVIHWSFSQGTYFGFLGTVNRPISEARFGSIFSAPRPHLASANERPQLSALPAGCIFADKGPAAFVASDDPESTSGIMRAVE